MFIINNNFKTVRKYSLRAIKNKDFGELQSSGILAYQVDAQHEDILFAKAFKNFFILCIENKARNEKRLKIWNEKLSDPEELILDNDNFYLVDTMREKFYDNAFLIFFGSSSFLEKSLQVIDLNTLVKKSQVVVKNNFPIHYNVLESEGGALHLYEQSKLLFKNKNLLAYFSNGRANWFSLKDKFLLQNGFAVAYISTEGVEGTRKMLELLELRSPYPSSLIFETGRRFLDFLKVCSSFKKIKAVIVHNIDYNRELEDFILNESTVNILPPGCSLLFVNKQGDANSLYSRKLLAKFREENFTNEFFFAEYSREKPQNLGSIIINFLN